MARLSHYAVSGQPQHVIQRGSSRLALFAADADYRCFIDCLKSACQRYGCRIHAHVLMPDHVHLLITPESKLGIGKVIQSVGRRYVQYFNFNGAYGRTGTLWEGRYKATLIDTESYLLTCYRYIDLNPVRACLVEHPVQYRWSSYRANALGEADQLVTPHAQYLDLGADSPIHQTAYRDILKDEIGDCTLRDIRQATNKGWALGDTRFYNAIANLLNRRAQPLTKGGDRRSQAYREREL